MSKNLPSVEPRAATNSPGGAPSATGKKASNGTNGDAVNARLTELVAELNEDGFRVVAVAYREFPTSHGPYTVADESDLTLAGFIGFLDPPMETAGPALKALAGHGVSVTILTGDNDLVTRKICRDVGGVLVLVATQPQSNRLSTSHLHACHRG